MALINESALRFHIRAYMAEHQMTQAQLAAACGVSPQYLSEMLRGTRAINAALAAAVGYVPAEGRFYISAEEAER